MRALCAAMLVMAFSVDAAAETRDCVEGPAPVRAPRDASERPANGLPTLGTMLVTVGAGTLAMGLFLGALGAFAAFDQAPREQLLPLLFLAATVASMVCLLATLLIAAGIMLYWWGWSLITAPPDNRPRCPPKQ